MEWLETDGLGGFAMGSALGAPTRRYHAILNHAFGSPANRITLINAVEVWLNIDAQRYPLSTFNYSPGVLSPAGVNNLRSFECAPWPRWIFECHQVTVEHEIFINKETATVCLGWKILRRPKDFQSTMTLEVRPLLSGRSYHALHHENTEFSFSFVGDGERVAYQPYPSLPKILSLANAMIRYQPLWLKNFTYDDDRLRGADHTEDLASPTIYTFELSKEPAALMFKAEGEFNEANALENYNTMRNQEQLRRASFQSQLARAASDYIVKRKEGKTIIAGYPWFADWGRDTFIAMRGLCLASGDYQAAREILTQWSKALFEGMLPNRFLEEGAEAEYNSVDAALWYIIACHDFFQVMRDKKLKIEHAVENSILDAVEGILKHFYRGTKFGIACDTSDGLLRQGVAGMQLTWMDAKIGDFVVTPRIGKAVEIQALWLNALKIGSQYFQHYADLFEQGLESFRVKFWNEQDLCLFDVIDLNHQSGIKDDSIRPNQIFAVGGLPYQLLDEKRAALVVDCVERHLYTPCGLRTLAPSDRLYRGRYVGGSYERDCAYHQGTVWPWLLGAFVEAWVRVRKNSKQAKIDARHRFLRPLLHNLNLAGLGHISEIHDGDAAHNSRGCPFQAWSVGEAIRLENIVLS